MKKYGIGVIGMGWMGETHSSAYINYKIKFAHTGIIPELIICSEILQERAQRAKEKFGFKTYSTSWKDVVDHPEVDIVDITAPNSLHLEIIEYCLQKNKHINCEKPVGAFPQETLKAYELSKNSNKQSFVGFNYRWAPLVQFSKELISSGKLGKIHHYKGSFFSCYAADKLGAYSWRFEKENGLGAISDLLSHSIDMAHYLIGDIKSVSGIMKTFLHERPLAKDGQSHYAKADENAEKKVVTNDDYAGAMVSFKNGCEGFIDASRVFYGPTSRHCFEIFAEKGSVKWNFEEMNVLEVFLKEEEDALNGYRKIYSSPKHPYHQYFNPSDGSSLGYDDLKVIEIANFLENIYSNKIIHQADFLCAAKVAKVIEAITQSNTSKKEEFVGEVE
ncbi:Gfo/Idh/MocA family oxidoreductase [Campylobacter sp. MIT 21-1685]|uniref:Gfo/Idh/MocA family protein n=1 Tax=unclassified Campylobacter TaxID=2593542 RepID=UPI00224AA293|nr:MULTISPECIES: Gfo/Idh/MocA family oxidoreductase [unclassified Campylobacter]MCX2682510.1 Gfo/Idh/MocA family oxidoreductase [Campylobacter sp. MIT 21-1684]MCX2750777.1 Gfo/Idh/MocA family oxidoreductase [Campylobacter sp. MIT 21-1682]MCX2806991.1 Gfo/Idh/MocA family oxidoreductase [Campylobacter sp. MIT 21-1685]